ncbi:MAG TPA: hypothetical protein VF655_09960 [Allosphingosinicella sp.]|jgi:hypothetical protein
MLPAVGAGAVTGNPLVTVGLMSAQTGTSSYGKYRSRGGSANEALVGGVLEGGIEGATESLPMGFLVNRLGKEGFKRFIAGFALREVPTELAATHLQDAVDTAIANPNKTWAEYRDERLGASFDTLVATAMMSGAFAGTSELVKRLDTDRNNVEEAAVGTAGAAFIDRLMSEAGSSRLRERDPEAFRQFVEQHSDGSPVENVFVDAEAVRSLFQSEEEYRADPFWGDYAQQIDEARALGGDVVIPTAAAAAHLAGTPAWDSLKEHARVTPGGMTLSEARAYEEMRADELAKMGEEMAAQFEADQAALAPQQKLAESMRDKLMLAGFRPDVAMAYGEMTAARYATRATRLGQELTGTETDHIEVRKVLPERLAAAIKPKKPHAPLDEGLLAVIDVMKRGQGVRSDRKKFGASLLDWIASAGGIEDRGGDLKSMGLAPIRGVARKGERKLIRPHSVGQSSMIGADGQQNSNSPDELALRAWEAGYFPEFAERPSVDDLLEAISEGISGRERYASSEQTEEDDLREAAEELYALLDQQGLDPQTASPRDIGRAIQQYQAERSEGRGYDQDQAGEIRELLSMAAEPGHNHMVVELGAASEWLISEAAANGLHLKRARHTIDTSGVRHVLSSHGDDRSEAARGNKPMRPQDFEAIPEVLAAPDQVIFGLRSKQGRDMIGYTKQMPDGTTVYLEEVFGAKGRLTLKTMWRVPGTIDALRLRATLDLNARSASQDGIKVVDVPAGSKAIEGRSLNQDLFDAPAQPERSMTQEQRAELEARQQQSMARRGGQRGLGDQTGGLFSSERDQRSLFHTFEAGNRGRITFQNQKAIIELFEASDLSTFIHESAHLYLEEFRADAEQENAPEQLRGDWEIIKAWFAEQGHAVEPGQMIPTDAHEVWARGFERFAMEGKSPSSALRKVFDAFRSWLLTIYKLVDSFRAPITPQVRDVMTRLLATDEEIAQALEEQSLKALFTSAEQAGMTDDEYRAYLVATEEARSEAHDALIYRTMSTIRRQRTFEWKREEAVVAREVAERVGRLPIFRAMDLFERGLPSEEGTHRIKLDRQWLIDTYGADILSDLPKRVPPIFADSGGTDAEVVAEMSGFGSAAEMIEMMLGLEQHRRELKEAGDKRSPRRAQIEDETAAEMAERHGDMLHDGSIEDEARALVYNESQGEIIASEVRALGRRANKQPTPYAIARQWAERKIAESQVKDSVTGTAIQRYERAARKAARGAEEAMLKGDIDTAFRLKQSQMLNTALVAEAKKASDFVTEAVRRMGKLAKRRTIKTMDQAHLEQAHALLEQVDLRNLPLVAVERRESFEAWANAQKQAGFDILVPPSFAEALGKTHWTRLTIEQLTGLDETVKQITHLGRLKQKLLDAQEERDFDAVVDEAVEQLQTLRQRPVSDNLKPTAWEVAKSNIRSADAALLKMEQLIDWMDGGNPNGIFNRVVWQRIARAQTVETDMLADYARQMNEVIARVPPAQARDWMRKVSVPELINRETGQPYQMIKDTVIRIALNTGNEGNYQRLRDGYGWPDSAIQSVLNRLMTKEDWDYVQGVWDTIETLWPQIEALEKRLNGIAPEKVEPRAVSTPFGVLRGGYFPAVYDPGKSRRADQHAEQADSLALFENNYRRATTRASATEERVEVVKRELLLDASVINRHIGEVIHDIAFREAIIDVDRLLSHSRVQSAVDEAFGREYTKMFRPWLQGIANEWARDGKTAAVVDKIFRGVRQRVTIVGLGYRFTTIAAQFAGYANVIAEVGPVNWLEGQARWMRNPLAGHREVVARSGEMRARFTNLDRDVRENSRRLEQAPGLAKIPAEVARFAFHGILYADMVITVPAWIGAFNKGQRQGMSEDEAAAYADKVIRQSQGAGAAKDLSAVMRSAEAVKAFTIFYSYFNALYARQRNLGRDWRQASARDVPGLLARSWWLLIVPNLITLWIKGDEPGEEEDYGLWLARKVLVGNLASLPGIREIAGAMDSGFGYKVSPISNVGEGIIKVAKNVRAAIDEEADASEKWLKQGLETFGLIFKQPTGAPGGTAQFLLDWYEGDVDPDTAAELWEGLTTGKIKEDAE